MATFYQKSPLLNYHFGDISSIQLNNVSGPLPKSRWISSVDLGEVKSVQSRHDIVRWRYAVMTHD